MDQVTVPDGTVIWHDELCTVTVRRDEVRNKYLRLVCEFHGGAAQGTLELEECSYGMFVTCPQVEPTEPTLLLDLYYQSPEWFDEKNADEASPPFQVELYDPKAAYSHHGQPWGRVRFTPEKVVYEEGV